MVIDLNYSCVIRCAHMSPLMHTTRVETPAAVQKWVGRPALWTKSRLGLQGFITLLRGMSSACQHFPEFACVCVWITRSLCHVYLWMYRRCAAKLSSRDWLKQCFHISHFICCNRKDKITSVSIQIIGHIFFVVLSNLIVLDTTQYCL